MALTNTFAVQSVINRSCSFGDFSSQEEAKSIPAAYVKVETVTGGKEKVNFTVSIKTADFLGRKSYSFVPNMNGGNFIEQAYGHLKTLDEYSGATDC